jgi:hypothetical protein
MAHPKTDNECTARGWTEAVIESGMSTLHVSFPEDTDLDDEFLAFCHDEQEMIRVKGWMIEDVDYITEGAN